MIEQDLKKTKIKFLIYSDNNKTVDLSNKDDFYQLLYTQLKMNLIKDGRDKDNPEFNFGESTRFSTLIYNGSTRKDDLDILIQQGVLKQISKIRYKLV